MRLHFDFFALFENVECTHHYKIGHLLVSFSFAELKVMYFSGASQFIYA